MKIYILDNYDSFTYNLVQALGELGAFVVVARNDRIAASEILDLKPDGLILSPGPGRPEDAGHMPDIVSMVVDKLPVLGVCLGHQMLAVHFGGRLIESAKLVHGKASRIHHDGAGIFRDLPNPLEAGRYHSLTVAPESLPDCLTVTARTEDGEIMGIRHRELPVAGVQFHPESILTPFGTQLLKNFLTVVCQRRKPGNAGADFRRTAGRYTETLENAGHYEERRDA